MKKGFAVLVLMVVCSTISFSQLPAGKLAISTALNNVNALGASYAINESMRLNTGLNYQYSNSFGTTVGIGASLWMYHPVNESITYFYGGGASYDHTPGGAKKILSLNLVSGAEYWFNSRFSWGAHSGLFYSSTSVPAGSALTDYGTLGVRTTLTWWFN
jgi:hypothetical protein